ncbi:MAG: peptidylprolyl isomerase [Calditrichaceae bacterium]
MFYLYCFYWYFPYGLNNVGNENILKTEVEQYVQNYVVQNRIDVRNNEPLLQKLKKQTLDQLIEQKLLLTKAEEDTLTVSDDILDDRVNQRINYLIQQVGSESELEKIFGSSLKDIRKDTREIIKEQLLVEQARSMKFQGMKVSRREVEEFYKQYKDSLPAMQETVDISHILKTVKPSDEALTAAYDKASEILQKIKNGADFAEMAEKYSDDKASAKRGGDLGLISRGDFVNEFETVAFQLKDGEISDIVQTQFGFHIIQMIERRGEKVRTRHILIQVLPTPEDEQRTKNELAEIREKILNGMDFQEAALKYSDDENVKKDHGYLGTFETDKLVIPEFQNVVKNLKPGEISQPFKTEYGYHIVLLNDRNSSRKLSLENDWAKIEDIALNFKMEKEYQKWIAELKERIPIDIRQGII